VRKIAFSTKQDYKHRTRMQHEHELKALGIWPREALERLAANWIASAEQVVAIAATRNGIAALAEQTGLSEAQIGDLVHHTKEALPVDIRDRFGQPAETSQFGLGALGRRRDES
jgi:DNA-binding phage protein